MTPEVLKSEKETHPEAFEISPNQDDHSELAELRQLIVQAEQVGKVLPAAIAGISQKNNQLAESTLPIVEENIRQSVKRNPEILAETLFPVIGPAIRKAIAETLSTMIQSLNQSIEHSFSLNGLKWRIEAWQTGKSFAEVVLLKTLIYRVEEIFLIHRETGVLLQHVSARDSVSEDKDMISGMLTAIQDFVHDSFKPSENAMLDALSVNDLSVWIERSPEIIIAAVIRGNAPFSLRQILADAAGKIQTLHAEELKHFTGEIIPFEKSRPVLEKCLQYQVNEPSEKHSRIFTPFNILAAILGIVILVLGFIYIRDYIRWSAYLSRLKSEPGIVVTAAGRGWFKDSVEGLRDPLSINPEELLKDYNLKAENVDSGWKNYQDLNPQFIVIRANKLLSPPDTIKLNFENDILIADGTASNEWLADFRKLAPVVPGVSGYKITHEEIFELAQKIESGHLLFRCQTADFADGEIPKLDALAHDVEHLLSIASGIPVTFNIVGSADPTGTDAFNSKISTERAEKVLSEISDKSAIIKQSKDSFKIIGSGSNNKDSLCETRLKIVFGK